MPKTPNRDRQPIARTTKKIRTPASIIALIVAVFLCGTSAYAQLTPAPFVLQAYYDSNGEPYASAGICVFLAGSSTEAESYTTAAGNVANANPLMLDAAGRPASGGFFLTPGTSYKLVFKNYDGVAVPSCTVPGSTGATVWSVDNVAAVPVASGSVDVTTGTAGENLAAGDAVYLSTGAGGTNAGQWYRTDADATATSTAAMLIGIAPNAIASGEQGLIRLAGVVTLSGLATGSNYYLSGTTGAITSTAPANPRYIGQAISPTSFLIEPAQTSYSKLVTTSTDADSLTVGGGVTAGTGAVAIIDTTGKIPVLNATTLTSTSGAGITGIPILLYANSGSTTSAAASNVDTFAITGLTAKDTLVVELTVASAAQDTASVALQNTTDNVKLVDVWDSGSGAFPAGREIIGTYKARQLQTAATAIMAYGRYGADNNTAGSTQTQATFTTNWTGSWTIALRQGGVTSGGTFSWSWSIYVVKGQ